MLAPMRGTLAGLATLCLLALGAQGCLLSPCDCGREYERDPGAPDGPALGIGASHPASLHCYCACDGEGPELRFAPSRDCAHHEVPCRNASGEAGTYVCSGGVR